MQDTWHTVAKPVGSFVLSSPMHRSPRHGYRPTQNLLDGRHFSRSRPRRTRSRASHIGGGGGARRSRHVRQGLPLHLSLARFSFRLDFCRSLFGIHIARFWRGVRLVRRRLLVVWRIDPLLDVGVASPDVAVLDHHQECYQGEPLSPSASNQVGDGEWNMGGVERGWKRTYAEDTGNHHGQTPAYRLRKGQDERRCGGRENVSHDCPADQLWLYSDRFCLTYSC